MAPNNLPPPPIRRPETPRPSASKLANWMRPLFVVVALFLGLGALFVLPLGFIGIAAILGSLVFGAMLAFHYFLWGRWINRVLEEEEREEQERRERNRDL